MKNNIKTCINVRNNREDGLQIGEQVKAFRRRGD